MAIIVTIALGLLGLTFVLFPLWARKPASSVRPAEPQEEVADEREQLARSALQEVELDFQLGNIGEPDYQVLRERYMQRALALMKSRYEHEQELDDQIEEQLRKLKEQEKDATD